jgi:phosphatidylglycerol:prolipoprotein diacylglycerol transferase
MAYIIGILMGWWLGKKLFRKKAEILNQNMNSKIFDDLITIIIFAIILGGRIGYIMFYNLSFYIDNPLNVIKIWEGGMSFHGALLGIILGTYLFSIKKNVKTFLLLDTIAFVSPIGIFFGRIANFINGELVGKTTDVYWSVIFPNFDNLPRHPSQLYEAFLEGIMLFVVMNFIMLKKNYKLGNCSSMFLIWYGFFRIFSEFFREPDAQIGYLFNLISMGVFLSIFMILAGTIIYLKKNDT